jgi:menaquinone-dependent protoporphyrinogen IX oxidase
MKTLVAFVTKGGVTGKYAGLIADILKKNGLDVDLVDLKKQRPDAKQHKNVIVGGGIKIQRIYGEFSDFLDRNDFKNKKVALFISSLEPENDVKKKYIEPILASNPSLKPVSIGVFGGRMKLLWKTIDKTNLETAKKWAEELASKLKH